MPKIDFLYMLPLILYTLKIALYNLATIMFGKKEKPIWNALGYVLVYLSYLIYFLFILLFISNSVAMVTNYYSWNRIQSFVIFGLIMIIDEWSRKTEDVRRENEIKRLIWKLEDALAELCKLKNIDLKHNYVSALSKDKYSISLEDKEKIESEYLMAMKDLNINQVEINRLLPIVYDETDLEKYSYTAKEKRKIMEAIELTRKLNKIKEEHELKDLLSTINQYYRN